MTTFRIADGGTVEMRNFAVMTAMDDCISLDTDNSNIWVHNMDFFYGQAGSDADQAKGDGTVDIHDVTAIQRQLAEYGEVNDPAAADMDGDGTVTISDVTAIQRMLAEFPI